MRGSDCDRLQLPQVVSSSENEEEMSTAFTVTVDLRVGVTTGISAADRSATVAALGNHATVADDLRKPGHVFPLRAREGGVLVRPGHTEAAVDLAYFSGAPPLYVAS
jgi:3,4-dihydroxy 2-butanone 4-phosphate synthase/GTP cyclohydrolase II